MSCSTSSSRVLSDGSGALLVASAAEPRVDHLLARGNPPHRRDQFEIHGVFQQITARARFKACADIASAPRAC